MRNVLLIFLSIVMLNGTLFGLKKGGYNFKETYKIDRKTKLKLNGVGFLTKWWFKIYANSLYLKEPTKDWEKILAADEPMVMQLKIIYDSINKNDLISALRDGFRYSTGRKKENLKPVRERAERFLRMFHRSPKEGDTATFMYIPKEGTYVMFNGRVSGLIHGLDFKKALFGIWLCEKPANRDLKEGLLGIDD